MNNPLYQLTYFKPHEFDSPDELYSGLKMSLSFLLKLDEARGIAGVPFKINSGYRTVNHNKSIGGSPTSSHLKGIAVDIACNSDIDAIKIVAALTEAGIKRIGVGPGFIHCDYDLDKPNPSYWIYK